MRIRKHAKLSSPLYPPSSTLLRTCPALQMHVCQLNRSPWDVMSFSPPRQESSNPSQLLLQHQHQGNGLSSAATSVSEDSSEGEEEEEERKIEDDSRTESQCRKEAERGHSISELPAKMKESPRRKSDSTAVTHRRNRGRAASAAPWASDDYYYYSGFGPLWGRTRGGRREDRDGFDGGPLKWAPPSSTASAASSSTSSSDHDNDEEDDGVYRKRTRKPLKSRSLKSIL